VLGSIAQERRHSSSPEVSDLQRNVSPMPTASTGAVQQTVPARRDSAALAGASKASGSGGSGLDRPATRTGQVSAATNEHFASRQPLARALWRGQGHDQGADSLPRGDGGRRSLAASAASDVPRAALEDVHLTDDELAHTQSGAEHDSFHAAEACNCVCSRTLHPANSRRLSMRRSRMCPASDLPARGLRVWCGVNLNIS
jgi:hypothetical protein